MFRITRSITHLMGDISVKYIPYNSDPYVKMVTSRFLDNWALSQLVCVGEQKFLNYMVIISLPLLLSYNISMKS